MSGLIMEVGRSVRVLRGWLLVVVSYEQQPADHLRVRDAKGEPARGEGEETPEGHVIRHAPGTQRIVGLTMISPRHILERDGRLTVTIPEMIETTAADLAPALAAV